MDCGLDATYITWLRSLRSKTSRPLSSQDKDDVKTSRYSQRDPMQGDASSSPPKRSKSTMTLKRSESTMTPKRSNIRMTPTSSKSIMTPTSSKSIMTPTSSKSKMTPTSRKSIMTDSSTWQRSWPAPTSPKDPEPSRHDPPLNPKALFDSDEPPILIRQPETRPISHEQLVAEVKGIYAGMVMVESKCIEVDNAQNSAGEAAQKLNNEQWMALIDLHRNLLHEHHDFFLASQHPLASLAMKRLASKYAMPARMWRHGIHSFLELLRHGLPASLEHILAFIFLAYSMMALLYETVPALEDTWIECLGDLGRYRMAIEDDDIRDRDVWTSVSRSWYAKAADKSPTTGRLYHHLAILARPNAIQQLYYYAKSFCVVIPFSAARESIMTLFDPILANDQRRLPSIDFSFVYAHGILFQTHIEKLPQEFLGSLKLRSSRPTRLIVQFRCQLGIGNCCANLECAKDENLSMQALLPQKSEDPDAEMSGMAQEVENTISFSTRTHDITMHHFEEDAYSYIRERIVPLIVYPENRFPWKLVSLMLNTLLVLHHAVTPITGEDFPDPVTTDTIRPLPEDYDLRCLPWASTYHPKDFLDASDIGEDEEYSESRAVMYGRQEDVLRLGSRTIRWPRRPVPSALARSSSEHQHHGWYQTSPGFISSKCDVGVTSEVFFPLAHPESFARTTKLYYYAAFLPKNGALVVAFAVATCLSILTPLVAAVNVERWALVIGSGLALGTSGTIPALQTTEGVALAYRVGAYATWGTMFTVVFTIILKQRDAGLGRQVFACVWFLLSFHLMGSLGRDQSTIETITSWGPLAYTAGIFPAVVMFKVWFEHGRENGAGGHQGRRGLEALAGLAANLAAGN